LGIADSCYIFVEESPGCSKAGFHLTDGWGNPRASATESKPPFYMVRVKGWCKRPPVLVVIQVAR